VRNLKPQMQFATLAQQGDTAQLGMWVFIATEVMFFGVLFFAYTVYRVSYPEQFRLAGHDTKILLGSINVAILLTSSLTMVLSINAAKEQRDRLAAGLLLATALLGLAFIGVKGYEYLLDYEAQSVPRLDYAFKPGQRGPTELFWMFYFIATGVHAIHLSIGVVLVLIMAWRARRGAFSPAYCAPLEVVGLYWSFVDIVWVFLFAAIYPLGRVGA
jgi:cytochrome c oxidase subunit 3